MLKCCCILQLTLKNGLVQLNEISRVFVQSSVFPSSVAKMMRFPKNNNTVLFNQVGPNDVQIMLFQGNLAKIVAVYLQHKDRQCTMTCSKHEQ